MNKLSVLPRGFGAFPVLEVLDLTYNNLKASSLPGNFFMIGTSLSDILHVLPLSHHIVFRVTESPLSW